jgi:arylamine N-acetyltransferase
MDATSKAGPERRAPGPRWVERYLALLDVERAGPSLEALTALVRAHKLAVPFANPSAILRRREYLRAPAPPFDCEEMLASWEAGRAGGVCFELSEMFYELLRALGYDSRRVLGSVRQPGDHQATVIEIDGRRYLADVGSGMPMLAPLLLEAETEVTHAGIRMRLRPAEDQGAWLQERMTDEGWATVFTYDLGPASEDVRREAYQRHHTYGYNFVVTSLTVVRCTEDAQFELRGDLFAQSTAAGKVTALVEDGREAARLVREVIGLPELEVERAIEALAEIKQHAQGAD